MPGPGAKQSPTDNLNLLLEMARSSFTSVPSPFRGLSCRFLHVRAKSKVGWSCLFCSLSLRHLPQASHLGGGGHFIVVVAVLKLSYAFQVLTYYIQPKLALNS